MHGISAITSSFYSNVNELDGDAKGAVAFSKVNMYLLNDLKSEEVELDSGGTNKITLRVNGKTVNYRVQGRSLYRDKVKICDDVNEAVITANKGTTKSTITLDLKIKNYQKKTTYIVEPKIVTSEA